ncbi:hypothetical protein [Bradyrhizobium sp. RP6]|uniref:hypothetical protein n=1 Tax=Bradyrhizobium sp. RP6 TaxID=2489596 RepID=UPI000F529FB9|nr:hypothetical protein [Bradyrhizobium sp. RP6]RQH09481.1 hypothetical protein EHH60_25520 [Bradyrhizobium sp. RP6]
MPPIMAAQIRFRPDALAASMARTLTLRTAPDALLAQWARSQLAQIEYLVEDGFRFELSPFLTSLADAERSGFAGRVGAGMTDLLMNALGYVWRDNATCLSSNLDPHADFVYAGGAVSGHGVVLAEAHGSFAQSVAEGRIAGEARRKYLRQVKPHIATSCVHGKVVHGYSVAFGSNPANQDTFLHVAETRISRSKIKSSLPSQQPGPIASGRVSARLALAAHRSNFLLMGASQVVAWIDWLRGVGGRPADDTVTTFFVVEIVGRKFLVAAEYFFPYIRPWRLLDEVDLPQLPWRWDEFESWRLRIRSDLANVYAMDEFAAGSFLRALSGMISGEAGQAPLALDLPVVEPVGLSKELEPGDRDEDSRYPFVQFRDGLALLGKLPRSRKPETLFWSPQRGFL